MKKEIKIILISTLIAIGMFSIFIDIWQGLEIYYYGVVTPRIVDDIISMPIFLLIYYVVLDCVQRIISERSNTKK